MVSNYNKYPYLLDNQFLKDFDNLQLKEQFVCITVLDWTEKPVQQIQGKAVSGSINVDGNSSVRRTANLTFVPFDNSLSLTDVKHLLSINKKIRLEVGFTNTTNKYKEYEKIWFPMGVYIIINPSISNSSSGVSISLQLKDKMCLLNGECGGVFPAAVELDEVDTVDENGNSIISKPTIVEIIQEVVHHFGGEQIGKIIVADLDTQVKQVMQWAGVSPLYIYKLMKSSQDNPTFYYSTKMLNIDGASMTEYARGDDIGYRYIPFTYPSELVAEAGSAVTNILDTIRDTLGNYEYFYDLDGNFVFQEKKNFLNTTPTTYFIHALEQNSDYYLRNISKGVTAYKFTNANIITSYSNTPQYNMIKNDLIVWGVRKTLDGKEFPIRYHLAIDEKPEIGNDHLVYFVDNKITGLREPIIPNENFIDSYKEELEQKLKELNSFPAGTYFRYKRRKNSPYALAIGAWNPVKGELEFKLSIDDDDNVTVDLNGINNQKCYRIRSTDWRTELLLQGLESESKGDTPNYYCAELKNEWVKLYDMTAFQFYESDQEIDEKERHVQPGHFEGAFRKSVIEKPTQIDYYLDFIDSYSDIGELSVNQIGRRTKVLNDNSVNCIFEQDIPNCFLVRKDGDTTKEDRQICINRGENFCQVPDEIYDSLAIGGYLNSAFVTIQDLLYQHTSYNESIQISCLPIYYLEPNTRIAVDNNDTGIHGDYVISSFSLPLDVSSTMSISASKVLDKI